MKTGIFKSNVSTPYGLFTVAVDSTEHDARQDIVLAAQAELPSHPGQIRVGEVKRSNRRLIAGMWAIKCCRNSKGQWAWIKKDKSK